jgi:hypothetical protein
MKNYEKLKILKHYYDNKSINDELRDLGFAK